MAMKIVLLALLLIGVICGDDEDLKVIDSIVLEEPCLQEGGSCTIAADCPQGQLTPKQGLCPTQKQQGVECCYGVSIKETRCQKRGGSCIPQETFCNPHIVLHQVTDCAKDEKCCVMV